MQVRISPELMRLMRRPDNEQLRDMIESLRNDPRPGWAEPLPERPGYYEFAAAGHWITFRVDDTGGETVITATLTE